MQPICLPWQHCSLLTPAVRHTDGGDQGSNPCPNHLRIPRALWLQYSFLLLLSSFFWGVFHVFVVWGVSGWFPRANLDRAQFTPPLPWFTTEAPSPSGDCPTSRPGQQLLQPSERSPSAWAQAFSGLFTPQASLHACNFTAAYSPQRPARCFTNVSQITCRFFKPFNSLSYPENNRCAALPGLQRPSGLAACGLTRPASRWLAALQLEGPTLALGYAATLLSGVLFHGEPGATPAW